MDNPWGKDIRERSTFLLHKLLFIGPIASDHTQSYCVFLVIGLQTFSVEWLSFSCSCFASWKLHNQVVSCYYLCSSSWMSLLALPWIIGLEMTEGFVTGWWNGVLCVFSCRVRHVQPLNEYTRPLCRQHTRWLWHILHTQVAFSLVQLKSLAEASPLAGGSTQINKAWKVEPSVFGVYRCSSSFAYRAGKWDVITSGQSVEITSSPAHMSTPGLNSLRHGRHGSSSDVDCLKIFQINNVKLRVSSCFPQVFFPQLLQAALIILIFKRLLLLRGLVWTL